MLANRDLQTAATRGSVSRRRFMAMLAAVTGLGAVVAVYLLRLGVLLRGRVAAAADMIERRLDYLRIDRAGLERFVADYESIHGRFDRLWLIRRRAMDDGIVAAFLMSSDFFRTGEDETRVVRYVMIHDPYHSSCVNPFSTGPA